MQCTTPPQHCVRQDHALVIMEEGKGRMQRERYMNIHVRVRSGALGGGEGLNIVEFFEILEI